MQVGIVVPMPESGMDPAGEQNAAEWLKDRMETVRSDFMEIFMPDEPDPSIKVPFV